MVTPSEKKIRDIVGDPLLGKAAKIEKLRAIESEARALQRAASEGPMNDDDGWQADLRQVRLALDKLGAKKFKKGAATL